MSPLSPDVAHPFWVVDFSEIEGANVAICSVVLFLSGVLCSAAGLGGGGIYVAVLMVAGNLTPHDAVPLSKGVVFLGSIASLVLNMRRSSTANKPSIDYSVCRVVIPAALVGTFLGVMSNRYTAGSTIVCLLTTLLLLMTFLSARTAARQYIEEEVEASSNTRGNTEEADAESQPMLAHKKMDLTAREANSCTYKVCSLDLWLGFLGLLVVAFGGVSFFHVEGCRAELAGETFNTQSACSHPIVRGLFWGTSRAWISDVRSVHAIAVGTLLTPVCMCLSIMLYYATQAVRYGGWSLKSVVIYQTMGATTGLLAGLVGVGGGLVFSPFFLFTGMDPSMAVATSATCVIFTSTSTTLQYMFTDRIVMSLVIVYGLVNCIASWLGTSCIHFLQDHFAARRSYISAIVAVGVAISAALTVGKFVHLLYHPEDAQPHTGHTMAH